MTEIKPQSDPHKKKNINKQINKIYIHNKFKSETKSICKLNNRKTKITI